MAISLTILAMIQATSTEEELLVLAGVYKARMDEWMYVCMYVRYTVGGR